MFKKPNRLNVLPEKKEETSLGRFPSWLHRKLPAGGEIFKTDTILSKYGLNTVCEEAKCPNRFHCYSQKTATFLVLGKECTRKCGFCDIDFSKAPKDPEKDEPIRIAKSVAELGLKHVVITMVARDDLLDGGASHLIEILRATRSENPDVTIEVLTSDFNGNFDAIAAVIQEKPDVFNHNLETVRRLTPKVRHTATYDRTLSVLKYVKDNSSCLVKSGMMVGLGETDEEVLESIRDLKEHGCDIITIGQYLQAHIHRLKVNAFVTPEQFKAYEEYGKSIGVKEMYCGPFVRSSFNAGELLHQAASTH